MGFRASGSGICRARALVSRVEDVWKNEFRTSLLRVCNAASLPDSQKIGLGLRESFDQLRSAKGTVNSDPNKFTRFASTELDLISRSLWGCSVFY